MLKDLINKEFTTNLRRTAQQKSKLKMKSESEVAQSCPTLCNPMDCSLPGSSIHGIFQAWILEWVAISFSRRSSRPRDWTPVSHIIGRRFIVWATREERFSLFHIVTPFFQLRAKKIRKWRKRCKIFFQSYKFISYPFSCVYPWVGE